MGPDHLDQCYYRCDLVLRMGNGIGMWRGKGLGWDGVAAGDKDRGCGMRHYILYCRGQAKQRIPTKKREKS